MAIRSGHGKRRGPAAAWDAASGGRTARAIPAILPVPGSRPARRPGRILARAAQARGGPVPEHSSYRVVVVGAGFGGLGMAVALGQAGIGGFLVVDRADGLGGARGGKTHPPPPLGRPAPRGPFSSPPGARGPGLP